MYINIDSRKRYHTLTDVVKDIKANETITDDEGNVVNIYINQNTKKVYDNYIEALKECKDGETITDAYGKELMHKYDLEK